MDLGAKSWTSLLLGIIVVLLAGVMSVEGVVYLRTNGTRWSFNSVSFTVGYLASVLALAVSAWGARRFAVRDQSSHTTETGRWILASGLFFTVVGGLATVNFDPVWDKLTVFRWMITTGVGIGVLLGYYHTRAVRRAVEAERVRLKASNEQQQLVAYLNTILRHEVLNGATVIEGYAGRLRREEPDPDTMRSYAETITTRAEELETVTEDVRDLLRAMDEEGTLHERNLREILTTELHSLQRQYDNVECQLDAPESISVRVDGLVSQLFSNVLTNAVVHNDAETPCVEVTVTRHDDTVSVEIVDNGSGIPPADQETLFDHVGKTGTDHGLGLSIVATLADRYDGDVAVVETGSSGTTIAVTLPVADSAPATPQGVLSSRDVSVSPPDSTRPSAVD